MGSNLDRETVDTSVIHGAQTNSQHSWQRIVEVYFPVIYSRCRRHGLNQHDANDVCQNVFKSLATSIGSFSRDVASGSLGAWINTIAKRKLADYFAKQPPTVNDADGVLDLLVSDEDSTTDQQQIVFSSKALKAINYVKTEFTELSWLAFWKATVDGVSPTDVARELSISRNAVYLARSRILKRLREELKLPDPEHRS